MRAVPRMLDPVSQTLSYMLGGLVIALALIIMATSLTLGEVASWAWEVLGLTFAGLLATLVFIAMFCWIKVNQAIRQGEADEVWLTAGVQAANGVATLALTYTLLGISLGIGGLAGQELTPDTVQVVIQGLTENFSMAFMTTVVGLPTSALLRGLLLVSHARLGRAGGRAAPTPEERSQS